MKNVESIFKIDPASFNRLASKLGKQPARYDKIMKARMQSAVQIVWATAHAKRPMITAQQAKAEGRSKIRGTNRYRRVSDPNAKAGVPVATGALQGSIQKEVTRGSGGLGSWMGRIWTEGIPYAAFIEYGTSKMKARPFMRPAMTLNRQILKQKFGASIQNQDA